MTNATVARRLFDDEAVPERNDLSGDTASLKTAGLIRSHGIIPIELNERLKQMARAQGRNADWLIGELIQSATADIEKWEAQQAAAHLRQQFGDRWLEILGSVEP